MHKYRLYEKSKIVQMGAHHNDCSLSLPVNIFYFFVGTNIVLYFQKKHAITRGNLLKMATFPRVITIYDTNGPPCVKPFIIVTQSLSPQCLQ